MLHFIPFLLTRQTSGFSSRLLLSVISLGFESTFTFFCYYLIWSLIQEMESIKKRILYDFFMILSESNQNHRGYDDDDDGRDDDERHAWRKGKIRCYTREKIFHAWSQKNQNWKETSHIERRKESGCATTFVWLYSTFFCVQIKYHGLRQRNRCKERGSLCKRFSFLFFFPQNWIRKGNS